MQPYKAMSNKGTYKMNKIKTYFALMTLLFILAVLTIGCNGGTSHSGSSNKNETQETTNSDDRHSKYKHGDKKKTCSACNGSGRIKQWYTNDPEEEGHWEVCPACGGEGWYYE